MPLRHALERGPWVDAEPFAWGRYFLCCGHTQRERATASLLDAVVLIAAPRVTVSTVTGWCGDRGGIRRVEAPALAVGLGGSDEGDVGGDLNLVCQTEFLKGEHGVCLGKAGERRRIGNVVGGVGVAEVEAAQEVEDELRFRVTVADVAEEVS